MIEKVYFLSDYLLKKCFEFHFVALQTIVNHELRPI